MASWDGAEKIDGVLEDRTLKLDRSEGWFITLTWAHSIGNVARANIRIVTYIFTLVMQRKRSRKATRHNK